MKDEYDLIMDDKKNALKDLPFQVKFMSMQVLAWMWSAVFGIYIVESIYAFGISAIAHALLITMTVLNKKATKHLNHFTSKLKPKVSSHENVIAI